PISSSEYRSENPTRPRTIAWSWMPRPSCTTSCTTVGTSATSISSAAPPNTARGLRPPRFSAFISQRRPAPGPMVRVLIDVPGGSGAAPPAPHAAILPDGPPAPAGAAHEPAQHPARVRRGADRGEDGVGVLAAGGEPLAARVDVAAHVGGAELGVELDAPGRLAPAEGVAGIQRRGRQHRGAGRRVEHALLVRGLGVDARGQPG